MPLAELLHALEREVAEELAEQREQSRREATAILAAAVAEARHLQRRLVAEAEAGAAAEAERRRARARLAAAAEVRAAREAAYQRLVATVRERLYGLRDRDDYSRLLEALLWEAAAVLRGIEVTVHVDPRDASLVEGLLAKTAGSPDGALSVRPDLETAGGVELSTSDGRLVDNTLEGRLEVALPQLRQLTSVATSEHTAEGSR
jgi:vacuolar-type H+-ATPase subunit E/Vma4